jgi:hypothetical protein
MRAIMPFIDDGSYDRQFMREDSYNCDHWQVRLVQAILKKNVSLMPFITKRSFLCDQWQVRLVQAIFFRKTYP